HDHSRPNGLVRRLAGALRSPMSSIRASSGVDSNFASYQARLTTALPSTHTAPPRPSTPRRGGVVPGPGLELRPGPLTLFLKGYFNSNLGGTLCWRIAVSKFATLLSARSCPE